ncbi:ABC transporter substrate-binding protein [Saccharibacillus qingshengii]|uniref:ABC transporter substrate-binding protein n=1 Tax=Saccharibacillus qingshengii TaxID=1763540 RepID=UPI001552B4CC|nr:extracellular solute-binding protein [Saccharibacillus qingshengii]
MRKRIRAPRAGVLSIFAALLVLPGCFSESDPPKRAEQAVEQAPGGPAEQGSETDTLRIGILSGEKGDRYYRETYTDIYEYMYPDMRIEIVPAVDTSRYRYLDPDSKPYHSEAPLHELGKLTEGKAPVDVLILDSETLRKAIDRGWTQPLAPFMQQTGETEQAFAPAVIDGLKDLGGGTLHALAPDYASTALYYNVDWFERNGVKLPADGMTWDEAFARARAASGEDDKGGHVYGLSFTQTLAEDPLWGIRGYTDPLGLTTFDLEQSEMTVDTPEWEKVWTDLAAMVQQKAIPIGMQSVSDSGGYDPFGGDLFLGGKTAMTIADSSYASDLQTAARNAERIEGFEPFNWETVTLPVHTGHEGIGAGVKLGDTFSVSATSRHQQEAWAFIRFVTGERMQAMELHDPYRMPSRLSAIASEAEKNGYRSEAFTQLRPAAPIAEREEQAVEQNPQLWQIGDTGRSLFQRVLEGELPAKRALEQWENDGRRFLKGPFTEDGTLAFGGPFSTAYRLDPWT